MEAFHTAIGHREITCVNQLSELPKSPITLCGPGTYQPTRAKKSRALRCYLDILQYLLPKDEAISSSHLWHGDLHVGNIFVDPSEPTKVVGLIDWQSTELSLLYFQARQPHMIDYVGSPINGLTKSQPRKDLDKLEPSTRQQAGALYLQKSLCSLYNTLVHHQTPHLYDALQFQQMQKFLLLLLTRNILIDGEADYLSQVAALESTWSEFSEEKYSTYPFTFSDSDRIELEADTRM